LINNTFSAYITSTQVVEAKRKDRIGNDEATAVVPFSSLSLLSPLPSYAPVLTSSTLTPPLSLLIFGAAVFLVSVPVFIEAPLVRNFPLVSLGLTGFFLRLSLSLMSRKNTYVWGDLLFGFSWSWLAGSVYWGWLRWEPLWHIPVESIGLPFAIWCLYRNKGKIGNWFYLGSLFGTVLTDIYFYLTNLMPYWRQIMQVEPDAAPSVLRGALFQVQTPLGELWALILLVILLAVGILPLARHKNHWYAFSGAVLSTILVDALFLVAAICA
jgi:hypothetical protein